MSKTQTKPSEAQLDDVRRMLREAMQALCIFAGAGCRPDMLAAAQRLKEIGTDLSCFAIWLEETVDDVEGAGR
jgi:hypothetical protein